MPLQITYRWTRNTSRAAAAELVRSLRHHALQFPFEAVGEIETDEWQPPPFKWDYSDESETERRFVRWSASTWQVRNSGDDDADGLPIYPHWSCSFAVKLRGCEKVRFGLAEYPDTTTVEREWGGEVEVSTCLNGNLAWQGRLETLYASLPQNGGWDNFLKQHTTMLRFLERAETIGLAPVVWDQGYYWETLNENLLREELEKSLRITAYSVSFIRRMAGDDPTLAEQNPILLHPDFEQLAEEGSKLITIQRYSEDEFEEE